MSMKFVFAPTALAAALSLGACSSNYAAEGALAGAAAGAGLGAVTGVDTATGAAVGAAVGGAGGSLIRKDDGYCYRRDARGNEYRVDC